MPVSCAVIWSRPRWPPIQGRLAAAVAPGLARIGGPSAHPWEAMGFDPLDAIRARSGLDIADLQTQLVELELASRARRRTLPALEVRPRDTTHAPPRPAAHAPGAKIRAMPAPCQPAGNSLTARHQRHLAGPDHAGFMRGNMVPGRAGLTDTGRGMALPSRVKIVEVSPRDGLQNEKIRAHRRQGGADRPLAAAGFPNVEAASFVAQVGAADGRRRRGDDAHRTIYSVLTPNMKG